MKLCCYYAHPFSTKGSEGEKEIIKILKSRYIRITNPFDGEDDYIKKTFKVENYYPTTPFDAGVWIWDKCIRQINNSDLFLVWIPEQKEITGSLGHFKTTARGCYAELQYAVDLQTRRRKAGIPYLIQMITTDRHPIIAWALNRGNQIYNSINDFNRFREIQWN